MKLICEVVFSASFIHQHSGKLIDIDRAIKREYDEYSEEYKQICKMYEDEINFKRETNKDEFDRVVLQRITEDTKKECMESLELIHRTFKQHCKSDSKGFIEFGGWILKIQDFSGVLFKDFKTNISKH